LQICFWNNEYTGLLFGTTKQLGDIVAGVKDLKTNNPFFSLFFTWVKIDLIALFQSLSSQI